MQKLTKNHNAVVASVTGCEPNPCHNGGVCLLSDGRVQCGCATGFTGPACEQSKKMCNSWNLHEREATLKS